MSNVIRATRNLVAQGFAATQVISQVHSFLVSHNCPLNSSQRGKMALKLCEVERRLADGG